MSNKVRIQDQPNKVIVEGDGELVRVVGQGPQGPRGVPGLDGVGAPVFGQVAKMTSGTITIAAQGVYQSTGLTAVLDGEAAGISLGTVDLFAVKNTSGFTRRLKISASYDASMAGATKQLGLALAINGVIDLDTECRATTGSAGNIAKLNTAWIIDLPDGQEVAMRVANFTSTNAIQFQRGRIVATSVAGFGPQGPVGPIGPAGGVDSVNGDTGDVVLDAADVGAYPDTNPSSFVDAAGASAAAPVQSVDSLTGAVDLVPRYAVASDTAPVSPFVGQRWVQTSTGRLAYWTGSEWVEIGALGLDLSVAAADPAFTGAFAPLTHVGAGASTQHPDATTSVSGFISAADKTKLDKVYVGLPTLARLTGRTQYLTNMFVGTAAGPLRTANEVSFLVPVHVGVQVSLREIMVDCTASGGAGAVVRLALYDSAGFSFAPLNLVVDAGTVSVSSSGLKSAVLSVPETIQAGTYWVWINFEDVGGGSVGLRANSTAAWNDTLASNNTRAFGNQKGMIVGPSGETTAPATFTTAVETVQSASYLVALGVR